MCKANHSEAKQFVNKRKIYLCFKDFLEKYKIIDSDEQLSEKELFEKFICSERSRIEIFDKTLNFTSEQIINYFETIFSKKINRCHGKGFIMKK